MRSPGTVMHARRRERASGLRARVRRRRRAHVRWCLAINPSANKTTQKARARPRRGRKWAARPRQTRAPICSSRRGQCGAQARPFRAASALAVPTCRGRIELAQNRDEKGGATPLPSTRTMVLCTRTRGSRVRCAPRQRRPGRAARSSRAPHALSSRLCARFSARFSERQTPDFSSQKNINNINLALKSSGPGTDRVTCVRPGRRVPESERKSAAREGRQPARAGGRRARAASALRRPAAVRTPMLRGLSDR